MWLSSAVDICILIRIVFGFPATKVVGPATDEVKGRKIAHPTRKPCPKPLKRRQLLGFDPSHPPHPSLRATSSTRRNFHDSASSTVLQLLQRRCHIGSLVLSTEAPKHYCMHHHVCDRSISTSPARTGARQSTPLRGEAYPALGMHHVGMSSDSSADFFPLSVI